MFLDFLAILGNLVPNFKGKSPGNEVGFEAEKVLEMLLQLHNIQGRLP